MFINKNLSSKTFIIYIFTTHSFVNHFIEIVLINEITIYEIFKIVIKLIVIIKKFIKI